MGELVVGAVVGGGIYLYRRHRKKQAREEAIRRAGTLREVSEIISCLVDQVYATDGGQHAHASKVWEALGYEEHKLEADHSAEDIARVGSPECTIRFMVFRRRDTDIRATTARWTDERPKYVVAIRGTKPKCQSDILDDIRHALEILHKSTAYLVILNMTKKTVDKYHNANVCVTGHSLGAAYGLLVARQLALDGQFVETHLFNPPFATFETLLDRGFDLLGAHLPRKIRDTCAAIVDLLKKGLNSVLDSNRDEELRRQMSEQFLKLQEWMPHLYVNTHDLVCNEYIEYFENPEWCPTSTSSRVLHKFRIDAKSYHLIPSAFLHTNDRSHSVKKWVCHKLNQWYRYPTTGTSRQYRLNQQAV